MNIAVVSLSVVSFVWVLVTVVAYFAQVPQGRVRPQVAGLVTRLLIGIGLAAAAVAWGIRSDSAGPAVIVPALFATMLAAMVLWLLTQRKTPVGDLRVKVGDKFLAFGATTAEGARFHSDELANKRTLLKFFRGGW